MADKTQCSRHHLFRVHAVKKRNSHRVNYSSVYYFLQHVQVRIISKPASNSLLQTKIPLPLLAGTKINIELAIFGIHININNFYIKVWGNKLFKPLEWDPGQVCSACWEASTAIVFHRKFCSLCLLLQNSSATYRNSRVLPDLRRTKCGRFQMYLLKFILKFLKNWFRIVALKNADLCAHLSQRSILKLTVISKEILVVSMT